MKRKTRIAVALIFAFTLSACALYAEQKVYIAPGVIELTKLLPPPPAKGSEQTKKEIDEILKFQMERTPEMVKYARADQYINVFRFADVLGKNFTKEKLPFTADFFGRVIRNESAILDPAKDYWNRPRPGVYDARVKPCVNVPPNASYPSGHSTAGNLMAIILADMLPEKSAVIFDRGWVFAVNRIIGGVHYRSDLEAGRMAAAVIAAYLFNDSGFKADYKRSKQEIRGILGYEN
jgi:acid phosphatase (class A)